MNINKLDYHASPELHRVIASIGRTEDVKFSADEKLLAVVDFLVDKVHLFKISLENDELSQSITLSQCITISSDDFKRPHGLFFLGCEHFVVTNRAGDIALFKCPIATVEVSEIKLAPIAIFRGRRFLGRIYSPGSVASYQISDNVHRVMVCNNYWNTIVSFTVELTDGVRIKNNGVLIKKGLSTPDGISISPDQKWVAVSNHDTSAVLVYPLTSILNRFTAPAGVLTGVAYPHGIRFSNDGKKLFVADAGRQYLHIYESSDGCWDKSLEPWKSIKMVTDDIFSKAIMTPEEGGLKGIDIANSDKLFLASAEYQVLDFYAVNEVLDVPISSVEQYIIKKNIQQDRAIG
ncbi:MAG: hypothetical protein COB23_02000 [Methylophaga sp.]|nr:MAG: hypothetical protein COB23_02000 [Methylophaga sp.]